MAVGDEVLEISQNVKARVVEGRHGVKQADARRPERRIILDKDQEA